MAIYSVHLHGQESEPFADPVFVCQSFSWKAFFFGPVWLALHRFWLGLALWIAAYFLLIAAAATVISAGASILIAMALQILLGLEASRLSEAKLASGGYRLTEIIAAPGLDTAEAAFYRQNQLAEGSLGDEGANEQAGGP